MFFDEDDRVRTYVTQIPLTWCKANSNDSDVQYRYFDIEEMLLRIFDETASGYDFHA